MFAAVQMSISIYDLWHKQDIIGERMVVLNREKNLNSKLKDEIAKYHDQFWIEKQIRDRLGLVKPGETMVIIDKSNLDEASKSGETDKLPPLKQWWNLFFK
jgi:cell division protein FtsB